MRSPTTMYTDFEGFIYEKKMRVFFVFCLLAGFLTGFPVSADAQQNDYQFARYGTERGLSHNQVNCFLKDRQGFVWIGTADGLNRFDGYSFRSFKHDRTDSTSIEDHNIISLFEDPEGYIWINTHQGYTVYDPVTERIDKDVQKAAARLKLPDANFSRVIRTGAGDYWFAHNRLGLLHYKTREKHLVHVPYNPPRERGAPDSAIIADFNEARSLLLR